MLFFHHRRNLGFGNWLRYGVLVALFGMCAAGYAAWQFARPASSARELRQFSVRTGEGVKTIGARLHDQGLLHSRYWFEVWVWLSRTERSFVAGEYQLPANVNIINATRLLTGAISPSNEVTVKIIEGWTAKQMGEYLERNEFMSAGAFLNFVAGDGGSRTLIGDYGNFLQSKPKSLSLEGYLFPDTYRLFADSGPEELVRRMLDRLSEKFPNEWRENMAQRGYTVHQTLTLASIVEREVRSEEDRAMVADIFLRRLEAGQGLQADSTVNYITGKSDPSVSVQDTNVDSPYNTYRYKGLPPGPISNPGQSSIQAVVFPSPNRYWYFLTTQEGEVVYSTTFSEHIQAKNKYLR